jgi:vacuolar-type H+-ATPase subunit H
MVVRLSELLERIRPIGTPGAPADATPQREQAALDEIAAVSALLAAFEAEADAVVAAARQQAVGVRSEADRAAQQIRADIPDLVAVARTGLTTGAEQRADETVERLAADADRQVAALGSQARIDRVVDDVVEALWQLAGGAP